MQSEDKAAAVDEQAHSDSKHSATRNVADEQLAQYATLKEKLSESKDTADVMRTIDYAIDSSIADTDQPSRKHSAKRGAPMRASDAETLDDVLKVQDALHVKDTAAAKPRAAAMALIEEGATETARGKCHGNCPDEEADDGIRASPSPPSVAMADASKNEDSENDAADTDEENKASLANTAEAKGKTSKSVSKQKKDKGVSLLEANAKQSAKPNRKHPKTTFDGDNEDAENEDNNNDDESDSGGDNDNEGDNDNDNNNNDNNDDGKGDDEEGDDGEGEDEGEGENEGEDDGDDEENNDDDGEDISMVAVKEMMDAERVSLDEDGYLDVVGAKSNREMERFVERLADNMDLEVVDPGGLKGMVPFYSGRKSTQSYASLRKELRSTSHMRDGWVTKRKRHRSALLQTESNAGKENTTRHKEPSLSLLGMATTRASRAAHKVPDLAVATFGSRNLVIVCTMGLLSLLFCLDERKRTGKKGIYENPLDMSPTPPEAKEDPVVAASLKILRSGKDIPMNSKA